MATKRKSAKNRGLSEKSKKIVDIFQYMHNESRRGCEHISEVGLQEPSDVVLSALQQRLSSIGQYKKDLDNIDHQVLPCLFEFAETEWKDWAGMRDKMQHTPHKTDYRLVWEKANDALPKLRHLMERGMFCQKIQTPFDVVDKLRQQGKLALIRPKAATETFGEAAFRTMNEFPTSLVLWMMGYSPNSKLWRVNLAIDEATDEYRLQLTVNGESSLSMLPFPTDEEMSEFSNPDNLDLN